MDSIWKISKQQNEVQLGLAIGLHKILKPRTIFALAQPIKYLIFSILTFLIFKYIMGGDSGIFSNLAGMGFLLTYIYKVLYIKSISYQIGDEQIIYRRGIFALKSDFIWIYRIKAIKEYRSILMRLVQIMRVDMITSDKYNKNLSLSGIPQSNLVDLLQDKIKSNRASNKVYEIDHS